MIEALGLSLFILVLIVGGVFLNTYLYCNGAFGPVRRRLPRRLATMTFQQEASILPPDALKDKYRFGVGTSDEVMHAFLRRIMIIGIIAACTLGLIIFLQVVR